MKCIPEFSNLCISFTVFTIVSCNYIGFFFLILILSFDLSRFGIILSSMSVKSWVQCMSQVFLPNTY